MDVEVGPTELQIRRALIHLRTAIMLLDAKPGRICETCLQPFMPKSLDSSYTICAECWSIRGGNH